MHLVPEFLYQQHNFNSDAHHLNNHMIDMVQKYMRGDATRMETYIDLGAVVYEFKHCKGIFARSKSTIEAIRSMHADFYDLPDDTRYDTSANSSNKIKILEEEVTINDSKQSLQTISPILSSEGTDTQCIKLPSTRKPTSYMSRISYLQTGSLGWRGIPSIAKM